MLQAVRVFHVLRTVFVLHIGVICTKTTTHFTTSFYPLFNTQHYKVSITTTVYIPHTHYSSPTIGASTTIQ